MQSKRPRFIQVPIAAIVLSLHLSASMPAHSAGAQESEVLQAGELQGLLESTGSILKALERIRGLPAEGEVRKGIRSKEEVRRYLVSRIEEEYPPEEIQAEEKLLKRFGLIPSELDLHPYFIELLTEQVAGYYDPEEKTLYIADWIPAELQAPVLAHELTHALQDRSFNLDQLISRVEGNDDRSLARTALVEGEGLLAMLAFVLEPMGKGVRDLPDIVALNRAQVPLMEAQYPIFGAAPAYLKESLLFPYTYGAAFLRRFLDRNSWSDVGKLYARLPESTEQILHPEKYLNELDSPQEVSIEELRAALPGGPWKPLYGNVLGEFGTSLLLARHLGEERAGSAAAGWDGDRLELLESESGRHAVLWRSVWDSESEAREFYSQLLEMQRLRHPPEKAPGGVNGDADRAAWSGVKVAVVLKRNGIEVDLVEFDRD